MAANRTSWDVGVPGVVDETRWDIDWNGPGTETFWDKIATELKLDELVRLMPERWLTSILPESWLARPTR